MDQKIESLAYRKFRLETVCPKKMFMIRGGSDFDGFETLRSRPFADDFPVERTQTMNSLDERKRERESDSTDNRHDLVIELSS